jgi:hypothetical protein
MKQKAFLRSFIKRIEFEPGQVKVNYTIPMPIKTDKTCEREVLSIEPSSGATCTIDRTFSLKFSLPSVKH